MAKFYATLLFILFLRCAVAQNLVPTTIKQIAAGSVKYQGETNTCWSFSTTSMIESQKINIDKQNIDISELFTARNLYIEKAKRYIQTNGKSLFEAGGLAHDAMFGIEKYGAIPDVFYPRARAVGFSERSNIQLDSVLRHYLDGVLRKKPLDPNWLSGFVKTHDEIAGIPPASFTWEGKTYTPVSFSQDVLKFRKDAYVTITSFTHHPYYQNFPLEVPDNFLLHGNYLNVPLDELIAIASQSIIKGASLIVDMDVTNNGWNCGAAGYALFEDKRFTRVTNPDTTELACSQQLRQKLFEAQVTQDDHLIHVVGIAKSKNGKLFFILKDSMGADYNQFKGFDYISEGYFGINALSITIPLSALDGQYLKMVKDVGPGVN